MKTNLLFIAITSLLFACSGAKETEQGEVVQINPEFAAYISSFTGGTVATDAHIKVQFNDVISAEKRSKDLSAVFEFTPSIEGSAEWIDDRTISFIPKSGLEAGTRYKVSVAIDEILTVSEGLEVFEFNFKTLKPSLKVEIDRFESYDEWNYSKQKLIGHVRFTGKIDSTQIKNLIHANQNGRDLVVRMKKESKQVYGFIVENIVRDKKRSNLVFEWNGERIGIPVEGKKSIQIPAVDEFVVLDYEVIQSPQQAIKIHFSDPLSSSQLMEGLVYLVNHDVQLVSDGQVVIIYPTERIVGDVELKIERDIKNSNGNKINSPVSRTFHFEDISPAIELTGDGNIIPQKGNAHFPFSAVNLTDVDLTITKIYEDNVIQFLQVNDYDGTYQLRRVANVVHKERIELNPEGDLDLRYWNNFSIDLSRFVKLDLGAIYRVELSAKKEYSLYDCGDKTGVSQELTPFSFITSDEPWTEEDWGNHYYYYDDYDYDYNYRERNDPCKNSYYRNKRIARNILISDLGIIAKAGADKVMHVIVTDLNTTKPVAGTKVTFYDYQQQYLGDAITDDQGMLTLKIDKKPFVLVADKEGQKGYLKLRDGESLSLSKFDVSGATVQHGVKGFIYTERGVWRPGDSVFVSFMLQDKSGLLPASHPVTFELINPKGIVVDEQLATRSVNGLYDFRTKTNPQDITGNYGARVKIGNRVFYKNLKVESVKPNRLKIDLSFDDERIDNNRNRMVHLSSKWLHGAIAGNLKTKVDVHLTATTTAFKKFNGYNFDDPLKSFSADDKTIFEGNLDENGNVSFDHGIQLEANAPGMLKAYFTTKVFEKGGDFSIDRTSINFSPFKEYVGIRAPEGELYGGALLTDKNHHFDIVTVNEDGKPVESSVTVSTYKLEWRWWWDSYDNNLASFIARSGTVPVNKVNLRTEAGKTKYKFHVDKENWGRYLVLVEDKNSGHITGEIVYVDWPYYARSTRRNAENATMLTFSTDKENYARGEEVKLTIPTPDKGAALVSIESGTKIHQKFWVETQKGETQVKFKTTAEMDPNVFIHVTLIQPYASVDNDLPIRMYGVVPILVEDPDSHLNPTIVMDDVLRPESKTTIKIGEKDKKPMSYTLAIVDEGLLDLTNFKTPDPWKHFNAREALGVKTWDMYDYVLGTYADELDKLLAIGGDEDGEGKKAAQANRFKPMVTFIGPFEYEGKTQSHTIEIPNYVGSVRVMVVAGEDDRYGSAEKTVPVRNPLMVLATLPRVVGPDEEMTLPVNVFAMEDQIKNVSVKVKTNDFFSIKDGATKSLKFNKVGDKIINFNLKVAKRTGVGRVSIVATSGNQKATYDFEIDVRTPNVPQTNVDESVLNKGEVFEQKVDYFGIDGTNQAIIEVSNFPAINLGKRLNYLIDYPHGCVEQTTSAVFPQLFLSDLIDLDKKRKGEVQQNINAGIERLRLFQTSNGGFAYWPGNIYDNEWGTNYAGHFLLEAERKGYSVPASMKSSWLAYQKRQARNWNRANEMVAGSQYKDITQAYRLYTLALAGKPELALMNRLRERGDLSLPAKWRLAAAYRLAGQKEAALALVQGVSDKVPNYTELSYSFGSHTRDEAMILETLVLLDKKVDGANLAKRIANELNQDRWMSTQTTAYSLLAISKFLGANNAGDKLKFNYTINGQSGSRNSQMSLVSFDLGENGKRVKIENSSESILYVRLLTKGTPLGGNETAHSNGLNLAVTYLDMNDRPIQIDQLGQGQDFIAEITISNQSVRGELKELALSHIVPSGWEIHNSRMDEFSRNKSDYFTYQDIRDDRILTYFDLRPNTRKTFRVQLNSSYLGKFYLPGIVVETMYDASIHARSQGKWVEVVESQVIN